MKLELKHLKWYLDTDLKCVSQRGTIFYLGIISNMLGKGIETRTIDVVLKEQYKPILRPLSDLTIDFYWKNLEDGDCELNEEKIEEIKTTPRGYLKLYQLNYLHKHHFDIHNLIENNLAIDINTL